MVKPMDNTADTNRTTLEEIEEGKYYYASLAWIPEQRCVATLKHGIIFVMLLQDVRAGPMCFSNPRKAIEDGLLIIKEKAENGDLIIYDDDRPKTKVKWLHDQRVAFQRKFNLGILAYIMDEISIGDS